MKKETLMVVLAFTAGTLIAGNVLIKENAESGKAGLIGKTKLVENARNGKKTFLAKNMSKISSKKTFKIAPGKSYVVSVWVKAVGDKPSFAYLGIAPYDANGKYILSRYVNNIKGSLTKLTVSCKPGDTVIKIKDGSKWRNHKFRVIAFGAKEDESDLPNFNVSSGIKNIEKKDGVYEITLLKPLTKTYPVGTKVREHNMGGYIYVKTGNVPTEWTKWQGAINERVLRKGVAGKLVLLCNWGGKYKGQDMLFDEFTVEEVK